MPRYRIYTISTVENVWTLDAESEQDARDQFIDSEARAVLIDSYPVDDEYIDQDRITFIENVTDEEYAP